MEEFLPMKSKLKLEMINDYSTVRPTSDGSVRV